MLRKILIGVLVLVVAAIAVAAVGLTWAHMAINSERAVLPAREAIVAADKVADRPVRLRWINTASQPMPRAAVLDRSADPRPSDPYVMSHPSFVLEWADGRLLLVDVGMNRAGATAFGRRIEMLSGGGPIEPHPSVAERLAEQRGRVQGVLLTHLHFDHVSGLADLGTGGDHPVPVFMTEAQVERPNFTTRGELRQLQAIPFVRIERLAGGALPDVPGFPGVYVIAAGGHTPGSQIIVAHVSGPDGTHGYVFTGDIVNNIDGINYNIPKPFLYRLLIVPESEGRLAELRGFLRDLRDADGLTLLVSHDQLQLEKSGVAAW